MRIYHINNSYFMGIQAGIQAAHAQTEVALKYLTGEIQSSAARDSYIDWARNHKTMIILDGGWDVDLRAFADFLAKEENPYAWALACEEHDAARGTATSLAVVLPEKMYAFNREVQAFARQSELTEMRFTVYDREDRHHVIKVVRNDDGDVCAEHLTTGLGFTYTEFEVSLIKRLARLGLKQ